MLNEHIESIQCFLPVVVNSTVRNTVIYLAPLLKYGTPNILESQLWFVGVTWHHRLRKHWTRRM